MFIDRVRGTLIGAALAIGVAAVPGFAQSNGVRWSTAEWIGSNHARDVVAVYTPVTALSDDVVVPVNLNVQPIYRGKVDAMLRRSATFRRQLLRLAAATHVYVSLRNVHLPSAGPRARSTIKRTADGRLVAFVDISLPGNVEELIAHEIEHVIEQIDGVDLAARAALRGTGVRTCQDGTFETERAIYVGRLVARQARGRD